MRNPKRGPTEAQITKAVIDHWRSSGLPNTLVASLPNMGAMGQYGLTKGLPDLLVMAPGLPIGFIELKADGGKLEPEQEAFKDRCRDLGVPYGVTFGRDEPIVLLEEWCVVRRQS